MTYFTIETSELAARLHGDPNIVHYENEQYPTIAPGLMQLQGFLSIVGWQPGTTLDVRLENPVFVPNNSIEYVQEKDSIILTDGDKIYSSAKVIQGISNGDNIQSNYRYRLVEGDTVPDWEVYEQIPYKLVSEFLPDNNAELKEIASVGVSANALVRSLAQNPDFFEEIYFPVVRENGRYAVLENRLILTMGDRLEGDDIELNIHSPIFEGSRNVNIQVSESSGLYVLEMGLTKINKRILPRILRI